MENMFKQNKETNKVKELIQATRQQLNITQMIKELKQHGASEVTKLMSILEKVQHLLKNEPTILRLQTPLVIVGDIHGQFYDLLNMFEKFGYPPATNYLFLGDYVDRGKFCVEVITLILAMKVNYPKSIHLLRGNHEGRTMTTTFNFKTECEVKYKARVYELFVDLFMYLPLCAVIDNRYFAVHGGLSPKALLINDIDKINRFVEIPDQGLLNDLLWSDPLDENHDQWVSNKNRSCSYYYSRNQAIKFLTTNKLRMVIRGHEVQQKGYKYQLGSNKEPLTLTIFSAPRYCDTYKNKGAVAILNGKNIMIQSFKQVEHPFVMNNYLNGFQLSFPIVAAKVTKIVAHLLKNKKVRKSMKIIEDNSETADMINMLNQFDDFEAMLARKAGDIQSLMLMSSQTAQGLNTSEDTSSESYMQSMEMKSTSVQLGLATFGPKQLQFIRVGAHTQEDQLPAAD